MPRQSESDSATTATQTSPELNSRGINALSWVLCFLWLIGALAISVIWAVVPVSVSSLLEQDVVIMTGTGSGRYDGLADVIRIVIEAFLIYTWVKMTKMLLAHNAGNLLQIPEQVSEEPDEEV